MRHSWLFVFFSVCLVFTFTADVQSQGKKKQKSPYFSDKKDAFGDPLPVGAIARIGTLRYRLPDSRGAQAAVLSPDGKLFASMVAAADFDNIEIWELPAWTRKRVITGRSLNKDGPQLQGLAFSADGKKLVTCDIGALQVHLLDVATGKSIKKFKLPEKARSNDPFLALSRDEQTLVCSFMENNGNGINSNVIVYDLAKGKERQNLTLPGDRLNGGRPNLVMSADARLIAQSVSEEPNPARPGRGIESRIELWNLETGKLANKIDTETPLPILAMSPDGKWLAASNGSSLLRIYDVAAGKELHNIRGRFGIQHLQFAPDGALYVAANDGKISRWDAAKGERGDSWNGPKNAYVARLAFPAQGKTLAFGMYMDAVQFWEVETGKVFSPKDQPAGGINEVMFTPQGDLFINSEDGMTGWWNPRTGAKIRDLKLEGNLDERGPLNPITIDGMFMPRDIIGPRGLRDRGIGGLFNLSPSGEFVASNDGGGVSFFDAKTGKLLYDDEPGRNGDGGTGEIAFLDGGARAASLQNRKVRIWNTRTGRDVGSFNIPLRDQEQSIRFTASSAGKYFVIDAIDRQAENGGGRVLLWDADKKKILREWPTQNGGGATCFSPDQRWLALMQPQGSIQLTRVTSVRADHDLGAPKNGTEVTHAIFSPDSRQLACAVVTPSPGAGRESAKIVIYEVFSKKVRLELVGHRAGIIERLAFSPDGALLASGATDTTALVWKVGLRAFAETPLAEEAPAADLDAWYAQMAGTNTPSALQNMIKLTRARQQTVKLLEDKIAPAKKPDTGGKTIKQWIGDLGSSQFITRNKANAMLQKLGAAAEVELRQALTAADDIETRRRIEELLDRVGLHEWTPEEVLHGRAVEVVQAIGTEESRALLTRWTSGDAAAVLTIEARKALKKSQ